ncbi:MAG TPA: hypothetical protein VFH98_08480 [Candidatus Limnocylindria bacterium]|jgi:hypothetical protein|nr:hypothetical protein [Candidatus Limnocylindria bacterium]
MDRTTSWHGRLYCQFFSIETHLTSRNGSWQAWVDTPRRPSRATGRTALSALVGALEPFDGMTMELLHSAPPSLIRLLEPARRGSRP